MSDVVARIIMANLPDPAWKRIAFVVTECREAVDPHSDEVSHDQFEDQRRSYALLDEHCALLAQDAAAIVSRQPDARPVGLIMEAGAVEASELRRQAQERTTQQVAGFLGIVPRELVLQLLRAHAPHALDFLEPDTIGDERRRLPLVAVMRTGYRLGSIEFRSHSDGIGSDAPRGRN